MGSGLVSVVQGPVTSRLVQFQVLLEFLQGFNLGTKGTALNCWLAKLDSFSTEACRHRNVDRKTQEMPVREVTLPLLPTFLVLLLNWKAPHSLLCHPTSFLLSKVPNGQEFSWTQPLSSNTASLMTFISLSPRLLGCVLSPHQGQILLYEGGIFLVPC